MSEIDEKEIKRRFETISRFELDPEATIRDLERTKESLTGQMGKRQARTKKIWRIIMKSSITKIATAAAIIIVVGVGIHFLGDGTSVAWSQVVEQINSHTKYKCRQRVVREQGPQVPTMEVYHLNLQQRRQEVEDGSIHIIDMRGEDAITVQLYPDQKKAIVTTLIGFGPKQDPDLIEMVKQYEQESPERIGTKKVNGTILQGFRHQQNENNEFTVWIDPATKLPVEVEIKHLNRGQTIFLDEFEFDFDLDESAFSTDVPDGYEVENLTLDYRPTEPKEVTAEDIRTSLNHAAYTVEKLPWMKKIIMIETIDPLGTRAKVYLIGIQSDNGNRIIIVQADYYDAARMVWIPDQQLVLETPIGAKLYTHPNGALYAQYFLEAFSEANPEFFNMEDLSEERFTRMVVMPDRTILGLVVNKQMSDEKLQQLVESLKEIKAN
jgi:succinate dehydrogenase flavin-adding protein (antitoxin of CptAB toxin-antitoxin module)